MRPASRQKEHDPSPHTLGSGTRASGCSKVLAFNTPCKRGGRMCSGVDFRWLEQRKRRAPGVRRVGQPTTAMRASGKLAKVFGCPFESANMGGSWSQPGSYFCTLKPEYPAKGRYNPKVKRPFKVTKDRDYITVSRAGELSTDTTKSTSAASSGWVDKRSKVWHRLAGQEKLS